MAKNTNIFHHVLGYFLSRPPYVFWQCLSRCLLFWKLRGSYVPGILHIDLCFPWCMLPIYTSESSYRSCRHNRESNQVNPCCSYLDSVWCIFCDWYEYVRVQQVVYSMQPSEHGSYWALWTWISMDFSDLSHFATMQVKLYVPGFLVVANPNNSVKNGKTWFLGGNSRVAQWIACWAHNPKVRGSKPRSALQKKTFYFFTNPTLYNSISIEHVRNCSPSRHSAWSGK